MIFQRQHLQVDRELKIIGKVIDRKTEARFLGVIITIIVDDKLTWSSTFLQYKRKWLGTSA